jgi:hypothetical protein
MKKLPRELSESLCAFWSQLRVIVDLEVQLTANQLSHTAVLPTTCTWGQTQVVAVHLDSAIRSVSSATQKLGTPGGMLLCVRQLATRRRCPERQVQAITDERSTARGTGYSRGKFH